MQIGDFIALVISDLGKQGDLNAALQAPVAQDLVVDSLSDLPEAKPSVAEAVIGPSSNSL